ncbi:MAG: hypothetical protein J5823_04655 [Paludibacteraceae bacterium]|nr:hypothetical protein [Paludibacteraceae bacterium]
MKRLLSIVLCVVAALSISARVTEQVLYYTSTDQHGDTLTLSGKVSVPEHPKGIILMPHYTIASNNEVPSTSTTPEANYLRDDYVLVMPDYIGYGASISRIHPYLRGDVTARNCVDMLFASWPVMDSLGVTLPKDSIYLVGFSQGGATVLWTLKLLEEQYADRVFVKHCYAGGGPYDVAATYDDAVQRNHVGMAMVIPMLVMGTSEAYDLNLSRELFFTPEMDKHYDEYITDKRLSFAVLYFLMFDSKVDKWLSRYGMDKSQPETRRMYEGFLRSSLVHYPIDNSAVGQDVICPGTGYMPTNMVGTWLPKAPVYVFHSYNDRIVSFINAEHLQRCWQGLDNVTFEFGDFGSHGWSMMSFFPRVQKQLKQQSSKP